MNFLEDSLRQGHVAVYDYRGQQLPDLISDKPSGTVSLFFKERKEHAFKSDEFDVQRYKILSDIRTTNNHRIDVSVLDGEAIKLLLAKIPYNGPYLLVPIALRFAWLVGLPGLLRRLVSGTVKLKGIVTLRSGKRSQRWLIIQYLSYTHSEGTISNEVGIQGLLDFLRAEEVRYAVLKSFENLPELYRPHGDLDILVADEDLDKVVGFLGAHPGPTKIDIVPVTSEWWPPDVAARILQTSVAGPAGSRVPAPKEAFLANAYNAVYIKGFASGIPSRKWEPKTESIPKNDYAAIVAQMAKDLDIQVPIELESLEEYLHQEGWRPPPGCFANLANRNEWLRRRFWTDGQSIEVGLGLLILKEKAVRLGVVDEVIEEIERQQFKVLRKKSFDEEGKRVVMTTLRGGNWRSLTGESTHDYTPAMAVAILDTRPYSVFHAKRGLGESRVRALKLALRTRFDDNPSSIVHSTDTPGDTLEYIEQCFPGEAKDIRKEVSEYFRNFKLSWVRKFRFSFQRQMAPQKLRLISHRILIRLLVN